MVSTSHMELLSPWNVVHIIKKLNFFSCVWQDIHSRYRNLLILSQIDWCCFQRRRQSVCAWTNLVSNVCGHGYQSIDLIQWLKGYKHWFGTSCPCQSLHTPGDQKLSSKTAIVNFMCPRDWIRRCLDSRQNTFCECVCERVSSWD